MEVLLALFCGFFVNLIKKSLTTRFGGTKQMLKFGKNKLIKFRFKKKIQKRCGRQMSLQLLF